MIWKDFIQAVLTTILAVIAIYFILKTESEVERIIEKAERRMRKR